jgi:CheY-like chemotaxis protein
MDGKTMSQKIRELPEYQNTPIIAITAGNFAQEMEGKFYPFDKVFEKPILLKHLHASILEFFSADIKG